jgi:hypothetical protein
MTIDLSAGSCRSLFGLSIDSSLPPFLLRRKPRHSNRILPNLCSGLEGRNIVLKNYSVALLSGRNIDSVRYDKVGVWHFGPQFDPLEAGFLPTPREEREQVLVI